MKITSIPQFEKATHKIFSNEVYIMNFCEESDVATIKFMSGENQGKYGTCKFSELEKLP
jgi:hypothetical protein